MKQKQPVELGYGIHLIDGFDLGLEGRTGCYILKGEHLTIVETSASPSVPYILQGLAALGLDPRDVRYIVVTHIHLDHAGGAGLLLNHCPQAQVVVHPKGARHLVDPQRLIMGARAVYGDDFDRLFDPIVPVPEERILIKGDQETLDIGSGRTLRFLDTPGHANHHFSIYDSYSNGIFTGDTIGVYYPELLDFGLSFILPTTSPNQFNPDAMLQSLARVEELQVERIYFGHFGMCMKVDAVYEQIKEWLPRFVDTAQAILSEGNADHLAISQRLQEQVRTRLSASGVPDDHVIYQILQLDLDVCSMGLVDYLHRREKAKESGKG